MGTRDCEHIGAVSSPCIGEAGRTGDWRTARPRLDITKCLAVKANRPVCFQCWAYCPEGVIKREIGSEIDYTYCKGCGICVEVCPAGAITMGPEHETEVE
jgi:pyruvate ferredoxin oxidoreductase delta subunit